MSENLTGIIKKVGVVSTASTAEGDTIAGSPILIEGVKELKVFLDVTTWTSGSVKIKNVEFADDSSFTVNLSTFTSDDYLNKNDRISSVSAIDQTSLGAVGTKCISLKNLALNNQKYFRVNFLTGAVSTDLTFKSEVILEYLDKPQIQS